jgi:ParB/RepB/Spo0J family partition protein
MTAGTTQTKPAPSTGSGNGKQAKPSGDGKPVATTSGNGNGNGRPEVRWLPVAKIEIEQGYNPRREFNPEPLSGLTESVRQHGVLQSLLVEPDGNGGYVLRDGERRLRAARAAGKTEVPCMIGKLDGSPVAAALVTALQREGLSPVEEAQAIKTVMDEEGLRTHKQAGARFGKPAAFIGERLRLLRLPEDVQKHIHDGKVPLTCAPLLDKIAKVSAPVASGCAAIVAGGHVQAGLLERQPWQVIRDFPRYRWTGDKRPVAVECGIGQPIPSLPIPADAKDVREWAEAVADGGDDPWINFGTEAKDAARAYGCLLEWKEDRFFARAFITDSVFVADLLRQERDRREKQAAEEARKAKQAAERAAKNGGGEEDPQEKATRERKEANAERERTKVEARGANLDYGTKLAKELDRVKPTLDALLPIVLMAFEANGGKYGRWSRAEQIGARLGLCRPDWQHVEVKQFKNGNTKEKVTYPTPEEGREKLIAWLLEADTPERLLGRAHQALAAATYADERVEPNSRQVTWAPPGTHAERRDPTRRIAEAIAKFAKPRLPKPLAAKARKRR